MTNIEDHSHTRTINAGLEFINTNLSEQNWFLQIECFDPHEPFFSSENHLERVGDNWQGPHFDWPDYRPALEDDETVDHLRKSYAALLTMCDDSLGRLLDIMDENAMWSDTALMVCTDHGFMIGERGWYGKNIQPWYNETINTPLFVWDPNLKVAGERREPLVQTIDFGPTLLDWFGLEPTEDMQGISVASVIAEKNDIREAGLFGIHGGHVCVTDGRFIYMRACANESNTPLEEYTLMPTRIDHRFDMADLVDAQLHPPLAFSKGAPVLQTKGRAMGNPYHFGTLLFDLHADPKQVTPLNDTELEIKMATLLVQLMHNNASPPSQFERLGLPSNGVVTTEHLLIEKHWDQVQRSLNRDWKQAPADTFSPVLLQPVEQLLSDTLLCTKISSTLGIPLNGPFGQRFKHLSAWQLAVMLPGVTPERLKKLDDELLEST